MARAGAGVAERAVMWELGLWLVGACGAWAQPRAIEVFRQPGYGRASDGEGSAGSGPLFYRRGGPRSYGFAGCRF